MNQAQISTHISTTYACFIRKKVMNLIEKMFLKILKEA